MKKVLLFLAMFMVLIPCVVKADMGSPEVMSYYVTPKSTEGANYYVSDYDTDSYLVAGQIKSGEKVKVIFEDSFTGELRGEIKVKEDYYYIYLKDFRTVNETYSPKLSDDEVNKFDYQAKVFAEDGLQMYKGPSEAYDKLDVVIPKDTVIETSYKGGDIWVYTEYKGTKGWVMFYDGGLGLHHKVTNDPIVAGLSIELKENNTGDAKTLATIPPHTEFTEYYELDDWAWAYIVTYNGLTGYADNCSFRHKYSEEFSNKKIIVGKDFKVYDIADDTNGKVVGTLKALKEFYAKGYVGNHGEFEYIECGDLKGYIQVGEDYDYISDDDKYYNDVLTGKMTFDEYLDIIYNDEDDTDENEPTTDDEEQDDNEEQDNQESDTNEVVTDEETKKEDNKKSNKLSSRELVLLCVIVALVIALTAIITIVLVNKKKNNKVPEVSESVVAEVTQEVTVQEPVITESIPVEPVVQESVVTETVEQPINQEEVVQENNNNGDII